MHRAALVFSHDRRRRASLLICGEPLSIDRAIVMLLHCVRETTRLTGAYRRTLGPRKGGGSRTRVRLHSFRCGCADTIADTLLSSYHRTLRESSASAGALERVRRAPDVAADAVRAKFDSVKRPKAARATDNGAYWVGRVRGRDADLPDRSE